MSLSQQLPRERPAGSHLRVVGLGDSTTAGTPAFQSPVESPPAGRGNEQSQYAYWMSRLHPDWEVLNRGVNGERTDQVMSRFARDVEGADPDYAIILAGVNDVYQGYRPDFATANLETMYKMTVNSGIRLVTATILPYNTMTRLQASTRRELNVWIRSKSQDLGSLFCDTSAVVADSKNPDRLAGSPDGLHPDVPGYRKMGEALAKVVESDVQR